MIICSTGGEDTIPHNGAGHRTTGPYDGTGCLRPASARPEAGVGRRPYLGEPEGASGEVGLERGPPGQVLPGLKMSGWL